MSTYDYEISGGLSAFNLKERNIYGSSRLGVNTKTVDLISGYRVDTLTFDSSSTGLVHYELSNHLGNVLATVSDKKITFPSSSNVDFYQPDLLTSNDYYAFGMPMGGREFGSGEYRFGFNGKEKISEVSDPSRTLDFDSRIYDSRCGRWYSIDPLWKRYSEQSPYTFAGNNPIVFIDIDGRLIVNAEKMGTDAWKAVDAAMKVVRKTNKELYALLDASDVVINVRIGNLNPNNTDEDNQPGVTVYKYSPEITTTCLGICNATYEIDPSIQGIVNEVEDAQGNLYSANINTLLSSEEQNEYRDNNPDATDANTQLKARTDDEVKDKISVQSLDIMIDKKKCVNKKTIAKTLAHELGHAHNDLFNTVKSWIWNKLAPNAKGHSPNDPSDKATKDAEKDFDENYDKVKYDKD